MSDSHVILHIPHAATDIPARWRAPYVVDDAVLARENLRLTDLHTDTLYHFDGAARIICPVSRFLVDVERFRDDAHEPMSKRGMGALYTATTDLTKLRVFSDEAQRTALLETYYDPHHAALDIAVNAALTTFGRAIVFDCHSFPSKALPYEYAKPYQKRPEICIGTDNFHTPPEMARRAEDFFRQRGYSVERDEPFSGALTPLAHYGKNRDVTALMFEVRKDLYMNEQTGEKLPRFDSIKADLTAAMQLLAE